MFTTTVEYEDVFTGKSVREELCFNLTVAEVAGLEFEFDEGLEKYVRKAAEQGSNKMLFGVFKLLVAAAYGRRSEDGTRFVKRQEWIDELWPSNAFEAFFIWLFTDPKNSVEFFTKIQPKDLEKKLKTMTPAGEATAQKISLDNVSEQDLEAMLARVRNKLPANEQAAQ